MAAVPVDFLNRIVGVGWGGGIITVEFSATLEVDNDPSFINAWTVSMLSNVAGISGSLVQQLGAPRAPSAVPPNTLLWSYPKKQADDNTTIGGGPPVTIDAYYIWTPTFVKKYLEVVFVDPNVVWRAVTNPLLKNNTFYVPGNVGYPSFAAAQAAHSFAGPFAADPAFAVADLNAFLTGKNSIKLGVDGQDPTGWEPGVAGITGPPISWTAYDLHLAAIPGSGGGPFAYSDTGYGPAPPTPHMETEPLYSTFHDTITTTPSSSTHYKRTIKTIAMIGVPVLKRALPAAPLQLTFQAAAVGAHQSAIWSATVAAYRSLAKIVVDGNNRVVGASPNGSKQLTANGSATVNPRAFTVS